MGEVLVRVSVMGMMVVVLQLLQWLVHQSSPVLRLSGLLVVGG